MNIALFFELKMTLSYSDEVSSLAKFQTIKTNREASLTKYVRLRHSF